MDMDTLIPYMKYVHAAFNVLVFILLTYQGLVGLGIRKTRLSGATDFTLVKKHRRNGPPLVLCGIAGFVAGPFLTLLDHGRIGVYPLHLLAGMLIVVALSAAFALSRRIRGPALGMRSAHMRAGFTLLSLYVIQIFLGTMIVLAN